MGRRRRDAREFDGVCVRKNHAIGSATVHLVLWSFRSLSLSMSLLLTCGRARDSSHSALAVKQNGADSYFSPVGDANERTRTASSERVIAVAEE